MLNQVKEVAELSEYLTQFPKIGFDTEFMRESSFFPVLELIQLATEKETWLIDVQAFRESEPKGLGLKKLKEALGVFTHPDVLKVVHAAQGDQECLYTNLGLLVTPTLDTSIAAALCGWGEQLGLGKLLMQVLKVRVAKGQARTRWSVRPLSKPLLDYAHADVRYLVELGNALWGQLVELGRHDWALKLSKKFENPQFYEGSFEVIVSRLAKGMSKEDPSFSALWHLVRWREERVRLLNLPRRWVLDDSILVSLAQARPKDLEHLKAFRGIPAGVLKQSGEVLLAVLRQAETAIPVFEKREEKAGEPTVEEEFALEVFRCFVKGLAHKHRIALKYLIDPEHYFALLKASDESVERWLEEGLLFPEAAQLIGESVKEILVGQCSLVLKGQKAHGLRGEIRSIHDRKLF